MPGPEAPPFDGVGSFAYQFGGPRYYKVAAAGFPTTGFTFTCRLRPSGSGPVVFYGDRSDASSVDSTATWFSVWVDGNVSVRFSGGEFHSTGSTLLDGNAHHLAVSVSLPTGSATASVNVSIDGILVAGGPVAVANSQGQAMSLPPARPLYIGAEPPDPGLDNPDAPRSMLAGPLTDVHVYRLVLSPEAILDDRLFAVDPSSPNLYLVLPLDNAHISWASQQAIDVAGSHQHAQSVINPLGQPQFGVVDNFADFPVGDRTVSMWIRGAGSGYIVNYDETPDGNSAGTSWQISSSPVPPDGLWHHLAVVTDSAARTEAVFIDGATVSTRPFAPGQVAGRRLLLGARYPTDAADDVFTGQIRDVWIWGTVRAADQVADDANGVPPASIDGLVTRWPLDPLGSATTPGMTSLRLNGSRLSGGATSLREAGYNSWTTTMDARRCDVVVSNLANLTLVSSPIDAGPASHLVLPDRDLYVVAAGVTIKGVLTLPSMHVTIIASGLTVDPSSPAGIAVTPVHAPDPFAVRMVISELRLAHGLTIDATGGPGENGGNVFATAIASTGSGQLTINAPPGPPTNGRQGTAGTISRPTPGPGLDRRAFVLLHLDDRAVKLADDILADSFSDLASMGT